MPKTQGMQLAPNTKTQARVDPTIPLSTSTQSRKQTSISRLKIKTLGRQGPVNKCIKETVTFRSSHKGIDN